jgi:hypothetical protein
VVENESGNQTTGRLVEIELSDWYLGLGVNGKLRPPIEIITILDPFAVFTGEIEEISWRNRISYKEPTWAVSTRVCSMSAPGSILVFCSSFPQTSRAGTILHHACEHEYVYVLNRSLLGSGIQSFCGLILNAYYRS